MDAFCARGDIGGQVVPTNACDQATRALVALNGTTYLNNVMLDGDVPVTVAFKQGEAFTRGHPTAIGLLDREVTSLAEEQGIAIQDWTTCPTLRSTRASPTSTGAR